MILVTIKIILQVTAIGFFGYLTLAFFQNLFCQDISKLDYAAIIRQRSQIYSRFKRSFKLRKYRTVIFFFVLSMAAFFTYWHELQDDWMLRRKMVVWQVWSIVFAYTIYRSNYNMKLKLFYDLTGQEPTNNKQMQEQPATHTEIKEELGRVVNYKKAVKYILIVLVLAIACAAYSTYSYYNTREELIKSKDYGASRDSILNDYTEFKQQMTNENNILKRERDSLLIMRGTTQKERDEILSKPIDFSNDAERRKVLDQMLKEVNR